MAQQGGGDRPQVVLTQAFDVNGDGRTDFLVSYAPVRLSEAEEQVLGAIFLAMVAVAATVGLLIGFGYVFSMAGEFWGPVLSGWGATLSSWRASTWLMIGLALTLVVGPLTVLIRTESLLLAAAAFAAVVASATLLSVLLAIVQSMRDLSGGAWIVLIAVVAGSGIVTWAWRTVVREREQTAQANKVADRSGTNAIEEAGRQDVALSVQKKPKRRKRALKVDKTIMEQAAAEVRDADVDQAPPVNIGPAQAEVCARCGVRRPAVGHPYLCLHPACVTRR